MMAGSGKHDSTIQNGVLLIMGIVEYACTVSLLALSLALWLEYRERCLGKTKRSNPYELIDLQREMQEKRERENETR